MRISALAVVLGIAVCARPSIVRAQQAEFGEEGVDSDGAAMMPRTLLGFYSGDIVFQNNMPLSSESFPHCKVMLSGSSDDNDFEFTGTAKEVRCGKDGKALGTGSFFLTAG